MGLTRKQRDEIIRLYLDPNGVPSYSSIKQFHSYLVSCDISIGLKELRALLREFVFSKTVEKPTVERFIRRTFVVRRLDEIWEADLFMFGAPVLRSNRIAACLLVIDVLSEFVWVRPLRKKTSSETAAKFLEILTGSERKPTVLQTDQGVEFLGYQFQRLLKDQHIQHQVCRQQPNKARFAENAIGVLKTKIKSFLLQNKTKQFIGHLPAFVRSMNSRPLNRLLGLSPIEIDVTNQRAIFEHLEELSERKPAVRRGLKVGDLVRLQLPRSFTTQAPRYTEELFEISSVDSRQSPVLYRVKDLTGELVNKSYYGRQLAVVKKAAAK